MVVGLLVVRGEGLQGSEEEKIDNDNGGGWKE